MPCERNNEVTLTEVKFYPEVKSQTSLSLLQVLCKCALIFMNLVGGKYGERIGLPENCGMITSLS